jgi:hypothetical protein
MNIENITWEDVLINKGIDESIVKSFIGFIAWDEDEIFSKLGEEINDVLNGYEGKVVAYDVECSKYKSFGILFFSTNISEETANNAFEVIQDYEHKEVYNMKK